MKATIQKQQQEDSITRVILEHAGSGYQIQITPARTGFLIHSSQGVTMRRYDALSYEVEMEVGGGFSPPQSPPQGGK